MSITKREAIIYLTVDLEGTEKCIHSQARDSRSLQVLQNSAEAYRMAIAALKDQEHADQPLTIPELREMNGATVYCLELNAEVTVQASRYGFIEIYYKLPGTFGTHSAHGLTLYRNTPEDARAWTKEEASRWKI